MGYYINHLPNGTPLPAIGKADSLVRAGAKPILVPPAQMPANEALICVCSNGPFDAAAYAFSEAERDAFNEPHDSRVKVWLTWDKATVHALTGYKEVQHADY
jgi:hypothetical protein